VNGPALLRRNQLGSVVQQEEGVGANRCAPDDGRREALCSESNGSGRSEIGDAANLVTIGPDSAAFENRIAGGLVVSGSDVVRTRFPGRRR